MQKYSLALVSDAVLLRDLASLVARDRVTTAALLAHIAEVDARRLYVPAGYPSMHAYCVEELRLSEDAAYKRIRASRVARQFPVLFGAIAEGRLHLAAVSLLAPHLTPVNVNELIEMATHRQKTEIEELLAQRFALPGPLGRVHAIPTILLPPIAMLAPPQTEGDPSTDAQLVPGRVEGTQVQCPPQNCERFLVQLTIARSTHDKLRHAQALLSHAVPTGDVAQVLDRALDALITHLEKRKFGAVTHRSRLRRSTGGNRPTPRGRYIPAHVRRAVWERDQGQCTFVSAAGHRCTASRFLEFDHVEPVARGGKSTVEGMRLRCRAHNQYEAERTYGASFMNRKRREARVAAAGARAQTADEARSRAADEAHAVKEQSQDVLAGLRSLGCRANQARRAVELSESLHGATLEERMRVALKFLSGGSIP